MNISSNTTSTNGVSERVQPVATTNPTPTISTDSQTRTMQQAFTKVSQLKRAELSGEQVTVSDKQVVQAIERAIKAMEGKSTTLEFSVHDKTNIIAVKVLDRESGEVIREIPPEKSLDFVAKLWEMAGILVDKRG